MKHKEWKVGLSLLVIISITAFAYLDSEPKEKKEIIIEEIKPFTIEYSIQYPESLPVIDFCFGRESSMRIDSTKKEVSINQRLPSANTDIDSGLVRIYIPGGLVSQPNKFSLLMKERYNIDFWEQGCVQLYPEEYLMAYNATVFTYLDEKYGQEWRDFLVVDTY